MDLPHQPFWCEENIWHLCAHPAPGAGPRSVLVLSGADGHVACWAQRAGPPDGPILWDYHVVLAARDAEGWAVWDLDTRLGCPAPLARWLAGTFPAAARVPSGLRPRFAVVPADAYRAGFASDRAHMRTPDGGWQQPPPPWPAIAGGGLTLARLLAQARSGIGMEMLGAALG